MASRNGLLFFPALVRAKKRDGGRSEEVAVVDLCRSYCVIGALLKYDMTLDDFYERYFSEELAVAYAEISVAKDKTGALRFRARLSGGELDVRFERGPE